MSTKIPVTLEGNLTADPEYGVSEAGNKYAQFNVAVTDRVLDPTTEKWRDGDTVFHKVSTFGKLAENVRDSLKKGDTALVVGSLEHRNWTDKTTGAPRSGTEVVADAVGPSLKYRTATVNRPAPKVDGPDASATGPVVTPAAAPEAATVAR